MSAAATTFRPGLPPFYRRRTFRRTGLPLIAVAVAILVGLGVDNVFYGSSGLHGGGIPLPPTPPTPKTVKLDPQEARYMHSLIREFVYTAVARKHLAESYKLIGPGLREGITLKQWRGGQVTAVPYPVDAKTTLVFEKPDWQYARSVRFQLHVITPDKPNQTRLMGTDTFYADLIKRHGRWLINYWVPRWTPPIPNAG